MENPVSTPYKLLILRQHADMLDYPSCSIVVNWSLPHGGVSSLGRHQVHPLARTSVIPAYALLRASERSCWSTFFALPPSENLRPSDDRLPSTSEGLMCPHVHLLAPGPQPDGAAVDDDIPDGVLGDEPIPQPEVALSYLDDLHCQGQTPGAGRYRRRNRSVCVSVDRRVI